MKIKPQELLRWVLAPLLAACLLAWAGMAYSDKVQATKPPAHTQISIPKAATSAEMQEARKLLEELQAKERENSTLILEGQRKIADWWLSFLAIIAAIMAIAGAFIPFLMGRKDKEFIELERELIKQDRDKVTEDKSLVERDMALIKQMLDDAKATVAQIHKHEDDAKQLAEKMKTYQSGKPDGEAKGIREAVAAVQNDPTSSLTLKLRADAIAASQAGEAEDAYYLWRTLTKYDATDAIAHFNAGYWAGMLSEKSQGSERLRWLRQSAQHSSQALINKPDMYEAASNWGRALHDEAQAVSKSDLETACKLWQQAEEKYQQALNLKPDDHDAANGWGAALMHEASALASTDAAQARLLRDRAEKLLLQHAAVAPGVVAYNLACVYGLRGDVANCLKWLKVDQAHSTRMDCDHIKQDHDFDAVRNTPEFIEWFKTVCPQETK